MRGTRKTKMVNVRVTPEEYEVFWTACGSQGIQSMSEFARHGMTRLLEDDFVRTAVQVELFNLRAQVERLSAEVLRIGKLVGGAALSQP